jgi:hypothetical protein
MARCLRKDRIISTVSFLFLFNFRHAASPSENASEVRWLQLKLFHSELYGFNRIGRVNLIMFVLIRLDQCN